jgi:hypothetical protein
METTTDIEAKLARGAEIIKAATDPDAKAARKRTLIERREAQARELLAKNARDLAYAEITGCIAVLKTYAKIGGWAYVREQCAEILGIVERADPSKAPMHGAAKEGDGG